MKIFQRTECLKSIPEETVNSLRRLARQLRPAQAEQLVSEPQPSHGGGTAGDHQHHEHSLPVGGDPQATLPISVLAEDHPPAQPGVHHTLAGSLLHQVLISGHVTHYM